MQATVSQRNETRASLYVPAIDGLRFLAILLVFLHHSSLPAGWNVAQHLASRGWIGVEIFFAISAFLLFRLLQMEAELRGSISAGTFYARRLLRIYPLMIIFPIAMLCIFGPGGPFWAQRLAGIGLGLDNFLCWIRGYDTDVPYSAHLWTLSYEFQFYLVLPLAFIALRKLRNHGIAAALLGVELFALVARWTFATIGAPHPIIWVTPFLRPESTLIGIAIAIWQPRIPPLVSVVVLVAASAALLAGPGGEEIGNWTVAIYLFAGAVSGSMLLLALESTALVRVLSSRPIAYLGRISFGLYVYHLLAIGLAAQILSAASPTSDETIVRCAVIALSLALTVAMAVTSYYLLERPFLRIKDRLAVIGGRPI